MNLKELLYRIVRRASLAGMWFRMRTGYLPFKKTDHPEHTTFCGSKQSCLPYLPWSYEGLGINGRLCVASHAAIPTGYEHDLSWHKEPDTGRFWPLKFFARISFLPGNPTGDIQLVWGRSRLQNLVTLGLISNLTNDSGAQHRITRKMERIMLSWINENPWLRGIHYISTMECALRLISICHAFDMVRNHGVSQQAWQGLVYLVHSHAYFIQRRLCLYAYAGNHTIGECAGLVYAGVLFPELPDSKEWLQTGLQHMEREASIQILQDGGNREQSFRYLAMIVDLCGLVTALLKHYGKSVPNAIEQAWIRGSIYLQAFAIAPDDLPTVGDSDDGYALSPYLRLSWQNNSHARRLPMQRLQVFEVSGYSRVFGGIAHGNMHFHHGKLGIASGFGHGHADALSICWDWDGKTLLVDPGTHLYDRDPHFRYYFRGTAAHNTVVVDGSDQALQDYQTAFGWIRPYNAELVWHHEDFDGRTVLLANHNGYASIGIIHWRALIYDPKFGWIVWDRLDGTGEHTLEMHWHIDAQIEMIHQGLIINPASTRWSIRIVGGTPEIYHGNEDLPLGWISRKYGVREPINTLKVSAQARLPHEFLTIIKPQPVDRAEFSLDDELMCALRDRCRTYDIRQD
ncbi:MAG: alginate lyase family protein [Nitrosomonas sp.]|nr:alginate lyase family protein [Nitrosomonas sp.]MBP6076023.1 alginate lyase family protein [Nitrosomonas sp.]